MTADERISADDIVFKLSGRQDVYIHFFAICVNRIKVLLEIIRPAMGMKKQAQDDVLAPFQELRHHYEHFEERLPGHRKENLFSHSESTRDHIVFGFETDKENNIVLNGGVVRVTDDGVQTVLALVEGLEKDLRFLLLERLDVAISEHPDRVPQLNMIDKSQIRRTVGTPERESPG